MHKPANQKPRASSKYHAISKSHNLLKTQNAHGIKAGKLDIFCESHQATPGWLLGTFSQMTGTFPPLTISMQQFSSSLAAV